MGKDSKAKESSGKGKGKQSGGGGGGDESSSKKGKGGKSADGLGTCTYVKGETQIYFFCPLGTYVFFRICPKDVKVGLYDVLLASWQMHDTAKCINSML